MKQAKNNSHTHNTTYGIRVPRPPHVAARHIRHHHVHTVLSPCPCPSMSMYPWPPATMRRHAVQGSVGAGCVTAHGRNVQCMLVRGT
eukprot:3111417-Prymnesium_polylepis.2